MNLDNVLMMLSGISIFLLGMKLMSDGLEIAAGTKMKAIIERLTKNTYMAALVGLLVTAIIHSSAATTVMVIGFVNAGVMELTQAAGVIMGANIGTTMTGLMVAMDLAKISPIVIFVGVCLLFFMSKSKYKNMGQIMAGFGMLFFGLDMMSSSMEPLRGSKEFASLMASFKNPFLGLLAGMIITAIIHSSTAIVGILQSLGMAGIVDLRSVVFIIYGQNIGTCVTALMASAGTNKTAKRAAVIHLMFNVIGTAMFTVITLTTPFTYWVERLAQGNVSAQIPIVHLIFNTITTAILLPLNKYLIGISYSMVKGEDEVKSKQSLLYLDDRILTTPIVVVSQILKETERMADIAKSNFRDSMESIFEKDTGRINKVYEEEKTIDYLNSTITEYLVKTNGLDISDTDRRIVGSLFHVISDIERIGDYCENICEVSELVSSGRANLSEIVVVEIKELRDMVEKILDRAMFVFSSKEPNSELFEAVSELEDAIDEKTETLKENHLKRLNNNKCDAISGTVFSDLITSLERIADHATNIAFSMKKRELVSGRI
ncbi:MAG: Na/Pi cotransporter family protein [Oscillospiraceae bacterium]|jgi:phosphate:Na+ symporter|nr:Na/Pi cotransporter family protein [Oscillospiraceae bacterium]